MKKSIITTICGLGLLLTSCDFLTEKPKSFLTPDNYFNTEKQMTAAVNGLYSHLSGIFNGEIEVGSATYNFVEYMGGYTVRPRSATTTTLNQAKTLTVKEDNNALQNLWQYQYIAIENCNSVIAGIEASAEGVASEEVKKKYLGEAYALRAYYYFNLVRLFGPIPYKTTPTTELASAQMPLTSEAEVFEGIEKDLLKAEELMANVAWNQGNGHIGRAGVKALLAKVQLTMAGYPLQKGAEYYAKAYETAKTLYNANGAPLFSSYADLRNQGNENSGEFLFSIQREADKAGSPMHTSTLPYPRTDPEISANPDGGGAIASCLSFYNSFSENDKRRNNQEFFYWNVKSKDGSTDVELDVSEHMFVYKFWNPDTVTSGKDGMDYALLRSADLLLILAEAKAMADGGTTSDATAVEAYWKVRSRAVGESENKPASISFETIYKERMWELCFENQVLYDQLRTRKAFDTDKGQIVNLVGFHSPAHDEGVKWEEADLLMPYPIREKRLNPNLVR
jgi:hypothetical protein